MKRVNAVVTGERKHRKFTYIRVYHGRVSYRRVPHGRASHMRVSHERVSHRYTVMGSGLVDNNNNKGREPPREQDWERMLDCMSVAMPPT
jgi:hypothetical protein